MDDSWTITASHLRLQSPVFRIIERESSGPGGRRGAFSVMEAPDWAHLILLRDNAVLTVRQWRHGTRRHSLEFPGGVVDPGEDPAIAARRELQEETGWTCGEIVRIGQTSPNPALMTNRVYTFLSTEPLAQGLQNLDPDELADPRWVPLADLLSGIPEFDESAIMLAGLAFLQRHLRHTSQASWDGGP